MFYIRNDKDAIDFDQVMSSEMIERVAEFEQKELQAMTELLKERYVEQIKIVAKEYGFIAKYYPSVEIKNERVYIYWKNYFDRNKATHLSYEKRKKIYGTRVKPNKRLGYLDTSFRYAFKEELQMILYYENLFKDIRNKSEFINKMRMYYRYSDKIDLDEQYEVIREYDIDDE